MKLMTTTASARLLCGAATGLAMMAMATPAFAQDEDPATSTDEVATNDDNEIVVSGIRASIETSLEAKRESSAIVEVISAEDIGQLPDLSIADSLARLPGVTAQRVRGRSQQISIRGLGPDFSLALLNGREVVSSGNNRGIEFDQFPSELIGQGVVYKTADARLAATGIAGAVDLRTVRPLDFNERTVNLSARYVLNDNGSLNPDFSDDGYRFFGSYIDQNASGTLGWAIGATVQSNPTQFVSRELKTQDRRDSNDPSILIGQVRLSDNGLLYPADNPRQGAVSREFERVSVAGTLQFEPSDRVAITLDGLYSDTKDTGIFRGTETPIASWSGAQFDGAQGTGPFADSAQYSAVVPILRTDTEGNESEIWAAGVNAVFGVTDNLNFLVDYGYSTLDRNDIDYESYAGTGPGRSGAQDTLDFTFADNGAYSIDGLLDYTDPANVLLTDPGGWGQVGFLKQPIIQDELHQLRAELEYEFDGGFLKSIQGGWLYTDREKNFDSNESFLRASTAFTNGSYAIPAQFIVGSTDTLDLGMPILAYDPSSFLTDGTYTVEKATFDTEWVVNEKIHNFYVQANIDTLLGDAPLRGNIGLKYADTEQSSTGTIAGGATNTVTETYGDWLPSMNLSLEVDYGTFFKVAAARTITRARLDQLAANQNIGFNTRSCTDSNNDQIPDTLVDFSIPTNVCFNLGGGNPQLQPYQATAFDLSFEKYISRGSALVIAAFYKDLDDWVIDFSDLTDASQQIRNAGYGAFLDANPEVATAIFGGPVNFGQGSIYGVETTLRLDFADLTTALDGFGGSFSYTLAEAEISDPNENFIPIPGYSEEVWSSDLYYDRGGLQAKVSARYRSGFLSEVQNFDGSLSGADALSETIIDAQIGYTFEETGSALDGLGFQVEVFNLTNEPFVTENTLFTPAGTAVAGTFPSRYEIYGRTFNFTIKKSF